MDDINLLPEDSREEEEKIKKTKGQSKPLDSFHLPENNKARDSIKKKPVDIFKKTEPVDNNRKINKKIQSKDIKKKDILAKPKAALKPAVGKRSIWDKLLGKKKIKGKIIQNSLEKDSQSDEPFDVNLIPEGSHLIANKKLFLYFGVSFFSSLLLITLIILGLTFFGQRVSDETEALEARLKASQEKYELLQAEELQAVLWSKRVDFVSNILDKHVYWTRFFSELEKITLPEVYYTGVQAATDGSVVFSAAADSYNTVAKQYLVYQQASDVFKQVNIAGISGDSSLEGVNFEVFITLDDDIYYSYQK